MYSSANRLALGLVLRAIVSNSGRLSPTLREFLRVCRQFAQDSRGETSGNDTSGMGDGICVAASKEMRDLKRKGQLPSDLCYLCYPPQGPQPENNSFLAPVRRRGLH